MTDWERSPDFETWQGCSSCRLFDKYGDLGGCPAYPEGIPLPIASGEVDHLAERPGQVPGVLYDYDPDRGFWD